MDGYWAGFFGCAPERLRPGKPLVVPHGPGLAGYGGIYLQGFGSAPVVSIPAPLAGALGAGVAAAAGSGLAADGRWSALLGDSLRAVVGPAWIGYGDAGTLRIPEPREGTRVLTGKDAPSVALLREACDPVEWEHGGSSPGGNPLVGAFGEDGVLAALAGYEVWGDRIAHIAVLTRPDRRGSGRGREVVGRLAALALQRGLVPQYRTLAANEPSLAVARALGFQPYATSLALRLATPATGHVGTFLASLDHPFRREILAVRELILGADAAIAEGIKWNAPSFRTSEWFATFHLRAKDGVQVILHLGAKKRADTAGVAAVGDPEGLLRWLAADRATVKFGDLAEVDAKGPAFAAVVRGWIGHVDAR